MEHLLEPDCVIVTTTIIVHTPPGERVTDVVDIRNEIDERINDVNSSDTLKFNTCLALEMYSGKGYVVVCQPCAAQPQGVPVAVKAGTDLIVPFVYVDIIYENLPPKLIEPNWDVLYTKIPAIAKDVISHSKLFKIPPIVVEGFIKPAYPPVKMTPLTPAQAQLKKEVEDQLHGLEMQVKRVANFISSKL